jgi:hypothetical protein
MKLPVFTWLRGYDRGWIRGDVIAGLTVWAVLMPEALAYATIAGVSPVAADVSPSDVVAHQKTTFGCDTVVFAPVLQTTRDCV